MKTLIRLFIFAVFSFAIANATPYTVDSAHTQVGFSVKHLMITNVKGDFNEFTGKVDFDNKTKTFNDLEAVVQAKSVDTGIEKRDNHLRSEDFFYVEMYPNIIFKMKSYNPDGSMVGDLTIRGVTKEVTLEVEDLATVKDLKGNNRVGFTLTGEINRVDFGLKWNKALEFGGIAVSEEVKIIVDVQAVEE